MQMADQIDVSELPGSPTRDEKTIMRIKSRKRLMRVGISQIVIAFIEMVVGIVQIAMANPDFIWPFVDPTSLITGILVGIAGVLGVMAGKCRDINGEVTVREKCMVIGNFTLSITSMSVGMNTLVFSIFVISSCNSPGFFECDYNIKARIILSILAIVIWIITVIISIVPLAFFCTPTSRHGYGFDNERRLREAMIRQQLGHQNQIEQLQRQLYGMQFGLEQPPPYEEEVVVVKNNNAIS